tara:strand:+ start:795 stop:1322 length:528 start_codon:yes stop_codon:yes gene_type:complete
LSVKKPGICYWITGLSGAGKTSLSNELVKSMKNITPNVIFLDGDQLRLVLQRSAFTRDERLDIGFSYARFTKLLTDQGFHVVIAVMGLFHELQDWSRKNISNYVEVFLDVPLLELERRDTKGLYRKYHAGQINNMAGLDQKADFPLNPEFHFVWDADITIDDLTSRLLNHFISRI